MLTYAKKQINLNNETQIIFLQYFQQLNIEYQVSTVYVFNEK